MMYIVMQISCHHKKYNKYNYLRFFGWYCSWAAWLNRLKFGEPETGHLSYNGEFEPLETQGF